jgi:excisionase family DNA binding protein
MNVYKPNELASKLKVSKETLRLWAEQGKIKTTKTDGGHRRYIYDKIDKKEQKVNFIYTRVSSKKQQHDLERQIKFLQKLYPKYTVISDISSGLNFHRRGLNKILGAVLTGTVGEIVVAYRDRLCRFGFELIENLCKYFKTTITVVDDKNDKSSVDELAEDLLSITTVFSARFYGKRKYTSGGKLHNKKNKNIPRSKTKVVI